MSFGRDRSRPFGRRVDPTETASENPIIAVADSISENAADEPIQAATSSQAGVVKSPIFVVERLAEAMEIIKSDAMALAAAIRSNTRHEGALPPDILYWPIRWKDCEKLFEHSDEVGRTLYTTFYFTNDCQNFQALAQYELNRLYRLVLDTNMLSHGQLLFGLPAESLQELKSQLDAILVKSMQFVALLKSYPLVVDIVEGRIRGQAKIDAIAAQIRMQLAELSKLSMLLFDPEKGAKFLPSHDTCFIAAFSEPYHKDQRFINGVYFKREFAVPMMADIGRRRKVFEEYNEEAKGQTRH